MAHEAAITFERPSCALVINVTGPWFRRRVARARSTGCRNDCMRDLRDIDRCILAKPGKTPSLRAMAAKLPHEHASCEKQMQKRGAKKRRRQCAARRSAWMQIQCVV